MKYEELMNKIWYGEEGSLDLSFEDAQTFTKILLARGYAVLLTAGDIGDDIKVSWTYAGTPDSLNVAHRNEVVFSNADYLGMLEMGDYEDGCVEKES